MPLTGPHGAGSRTHGGGLHIRGWLDGWDVQLFQHPVYVAFGSNVVGGTEEVAFCAHHKCGPDDADAGFAVHLFFAPHRVCGHGVVFGVRKQREVELLPGCEGGQAFGGVGGNTDHGVPGGVGAGVVVSEVTCLCGAAGGHCGGVEIHNHVVATVFRQGESVAVVGGQREIGGGVASFESFGHGDNPTWAFSGRASVRRDPTSGSVVL